MIRRILVILIVFLEGMTYASGYAAYHWNKGRGYAPFRHATSEGIQINNKTYKDIDDALMFKETAEGLSLSFRVTNLHGNPSARYVYVNEEGKYKKKTNPDWGFFVLTEKGDSIKFTIGRSEKDKVITSSPETDIKISYQGEVTNITTTATDSHTGPNLWQIKATPNLLTLSGGHVVQEMIAVTDIEDCNFTGFGFFAGPASEIKITDISLSLEKVIGPEKSLWWNKEELKKYIENSDDELEGFWMIFDRDLEESLLKPGGDYLLGIVKDKEDYQIIYLEGASVNSSKWETGMVKGYLRVTPFEDVFDAEWTDAEGETISTGVKAQTGEGNTLTIQFPYHSSSLRLRKVPIEKIKIN